MSTPSGFSNKQEDYTEAADDLNFLLWSIEEEQRRDQQEPFDSESFFKIV